MSRVGQKFLRQDVLPTLTLGYMPDAQPEYLVLRDRERAPVALWWPPEDREEAHVLWRVMERCVKDCAREAAPPPCASAGSTAGQALLASLQRREGGKGPGGGGGSAGGAAAPMAPSVALLFASVGGASAAAGEHSAGLPPLSPPPPQPPQQQQQQQQHRSPELLGARAAAGPAVGSGSSGTASALQRAGSDGSGAGGSSRGSGSSSGAGSSGSSGSSGSVLASMELSRDAFRATLTDFLSDDRFLDALHARYLQSLAARRERAKGAGAGGPQTQ